jgi:hypothetical protein
MSNLPDWVTPGGTVYLHHPGGFSSPGRVVKAEITKITARDIVVGTYRFRKDRLRRPYYGSGDLYFDGPQSAHYHPSLLGPEDPRIEGIEAARHAQVAENDARQAAEDWQRNRTPDKARATIAALEAWLKIAE